MEERSFVNIKDDFGKVRTFEVPNLEMKIAIDNIDKEIKEQNKYDAMRYVVTYDIIDKEDYISYIAQNQNDRDIISFFDTEREILKQVIWKIVKKMPNEKYKKILYMRFKNKMKFNKIAEKLNCSKQSISDNYKTAIEDFRVLLCEDKDFQNTYFFYHWKDHLKNETKFIAKEKLQNLSKTKDFSTITSIDKVIDLIDELKTIQKKEKKVGLVENTKQGFKKQKFELFGQTFSVQDMIKVVDGFLKPIREKNKGN